MNEITMQQAVAAYSRAVGDGKREDVYGSSMREVWDAVVDEGAKIVLAPGSLDEVLVVREPNGSLVAIREEGGEFFGADIGSYL